MKRQISSGQTFLLKVMLPAIGIIYAVIGPIGILSKKNADHPLLPAFLLFGLLLICNVIIHFIFRRFKKVCIDDKFLYASNYLKEISIPLADIQEITESTYGKLRPIRIHLKIASEFGSIITFIPKVRFSKRSLPNPVVKELRILAKIENASKNH